MFHPETLLLVDDDEAELAKLDVGLEQTVRADEDVHLARGGGFEDFFLLRAGAETADHLDSDGVAGHALAEGVEMLLGEDGGRDEERDLAAALDGFEGGADGDLGFAETDVAADEAVHRPGFFHVGLGVGDGFELVARLGEGEGALELALPGGVGRAGETGLGLALGVDAEQLGGEVDGGTLGGLTGFFPATGADAAELGFGFAEADIAADEVRFLERDVQGDVVVELKGDDLANALRGVEFGEAAVEGDAVLEVDDEVAFDEFGEIEELVDLRALSGGSDDAGGAAGALAAKDFGLGDDDEAGGVRSEVCPRERGAGGAEGDFKTLVEGTAEEERLEDL